MATIGRPLPSVPQDRRDVHFVRNSRKRRSEVGPGYADQCLQNAIAKCECEVLQQPGAMSGLVRSSSTSNVGFNDPNDLIPALSRTICLTRDEDGAYLLTVLMPQTKTIFLCIPLTGILSGELTYDNSNPRWHEVTVSINKEQTRRLIFKLNSTPEAIDFNLHLEVALEETLQSVGEKSSTFTTCEEVFDENVQTKERDRTSSMMSLATPPPVPSVRQQQVMLPESPSLSTYEVPVELQQKGIPFSNSEMQLLATELTAAIMAGDVRKAQEAVTILAQEHVKVHINIDADYEERVNREQEISVTVHVEDRESPGLTLNNVKVRPSDTIYDLKCRFLGNYKFPLEVQKWIIGNRICADDETLSKCNVKNSGHTLYLYLLNARAANITREDYARQLQAITGAGRDQSHMSSGEGDYESLHFPLGATSGQSPGIAGQDPLHSTSPSQIQGLVQGSALRQLSASSSVPSLVSGTSVLPELIGALEISSELSSGHSPGRRVTESRQGQRHDIISGSSGVEQLRRLMTESVIHTQQSKEKEMGWECKSCTLINQPTRPGCEACGEARPADYRVPEGYIISEEERRRLEIERQVESLMQQASRQRQSQGQELGGAAQGNEEFSNRPLNPQELDLILRFNDTIQEHFRGLGNQGNNVPSVTPRGIQEEMPSLRQPVQNIELGEDVPGTHHSWEENNSSPL